jgi:two-component system, NarL family, nitrate/nitrite response regulator NarL
MVTQLQPVRHEDVSRSREPASVAEALMEQLVRQMNLGEVASNGPAVGSGLEEILLQMDVDGVRYLLIRQQLPAWGTQVRLSPREQEIARMVADGYPNKTIAAVLEISCWTVGMHLRHVFAKLGVASRAAMVARVLRDGLAGGGRCV